MNNNKSNHFHNNMVRNRICNNEEKTITVKMSVDFIRFSIHSTELNTKEFFNLFNAISSMSTAPSEYRYKAGNGYNQTKKYLINYKNKEYKVVASRNEKETFKPMMVTMHDPDTALLQHLKPYLDDLKYHVNAIEFTLDFIGDEPSKVYQFMKSHLLLKWAGKKKLTLNYETTFYRNDIRKTKGKGLRGYRKQLINADGSEVESIRIELVVKRPLFKRKEVTTIEDVLEIDNQIPLNYLSFKEFNFRKFITRLKESDYDNSKINDLVGVFEQDIKNGFLYELNDIALSHSNKYDSDCYLDKHDFHQYFMSKVKGLSFLNGDSFAVELDKMM